MKKIRRPKRISNREIALRLKRIEYFCNQMALNINWFFDNSRVDQTMQRYTKLIKREQEKK